MLYPSINGGSIMATPYNNQEDYDAYKQGMLSSFIPNYTLSERKIKHQEFIKKYHTEIHVDSLTLKQMIKEVFSEEYREKAFRMISRAEHESCEDYYTFIHSYNYSEFNISCMVLDSIKF